MLPRITHQVSPLTGLQEIVLLREAQAVGPRQAPRFVPVILHRGEVAVVQRLGGPQELLDLIVPAREVRQQGIPGEADVVGGRGRIVRDPTALTAEPFPIRAAGADVAVLMATGLALVVQRLARFLLVPATAGTRHLVLLPLHASFLLLLAPAKLLLMATVGIPAADIPVLL